MNFLVQGDVHQTQKSGKFCVLKIETDPKTRAVTSTGMNRVQAEAMPVGAAIPWASEKQIGKHSI